jgi:hypothetical protein
MRVENAREFLYTIYNKQMLAIMPTLDKFRKYLVGARFVEIRSQQP